MTCPPRAIANLLPGSPRAAGARNPSDAFSPTGALVKAVMLGGAAAITGFEADTGLPVDWPPSFRLGFGRVFLGAAAGGVHGRRHMGWACCLVLASLHAYVVLVTAHNNAQVHPCCCLLCRQFCLPGRPGG